MVYLLPFVINFTLYLIIAIKEINDMFEQKKKSDKEIKRMTLQ